MADPQQMDRWRKVQREQYFFLKATRQVAAAADADAVDFDVAVTGSQQHVYHVTVARGARLKCTCPDSTLRGAELLCKHCLFVGARLLRLDVWDDVVYCGGAVALTRWPAAEAQLEALCAGAGIARSPQQEALLQRYLAATAAGQDTGAEAAATVAAAVAAAGAGVDAAAGAAAATPAAATNTELDCTLARLNALTPEDLCPICYDVLVPTGEPPTAAHAGALVSCGRCRNMLHDTCMHTWRTHGRSICPFCNAAWCGRRLPGVGTRDDDGDSDGGGHRAATARRPAKRARREAPADGGAGGGNWKYLKL